MLESAITDSQKVNISLLLAVNEIRDYLKQTKEMKIDGVDKTTIARKGKQTT